MRRDTTVDPEARRNWSAGVRRLGLCSSVVVVGVGVLYVGVIALWLIAEATPRKPVGDPYLAVMEVLTFFSALALMGLVMALWHFAGADRRVCALTALLFGSLGAVVTMGVHFVQLTAVRQMWHAGEVLDYRLVWPSALFAVEYFAWDILVGVTMVAAGLSLSDRTVGASARRALLAGGGLCLVGVAGPLSGWMVLQNVSLFGYAVMLPVAAALLARMFYVTKPSAPGTS